MRHRRYYSYITLATLFWAILPCCAPAAENEIALGSKVADFARRDDLSSIQNLIQEQEAVWETSPDVSYFENMEAIAMGLRTGADNTRQYWLYRKAIWEVLLKPFPPVGGSSDIETILNSKERLLAFARSAASWNSTVSDNMKIAMRHDTALMFLEYTRQLRAEMIPGYINRPVAAVNDPIGRERLRQNEINNAVQLYVRDALQRLARNHFHYLSDAYSQRPTNSLELIQLLDALNIQGVDRRYVLEATK